MSHVIPLELSDAPSAAQADLKQIQAKTGRLNNLMLTLAHSPTALHAYLGSSAALSGGLLSPALREKLALLTAQFNGCDYCLAAHTILGLKRGLSEHELQLSRRARAADAQQLAALHFAWRVLHTRGKVSTRDVLEVHNAGFSDGHILEITATIAHNVLTNYVNNVAGTPIDFPLAPDLPELEELEECV